MTEKKQALPQVRGIYAFRWISRGRNLINPLQVYRDICERDIGEGTNPYPQWRKSCKECVTIRGRKATIVKVYG